MVEDKRIKGMKKSSLDTPTCDECGSRTKYYHGLLGYEAFVCVKCDKHVSHT